MSRLPITKFLAWVASLFGDGGVIDSTSLTFSLKASGYQGREPKTFTRPALEAWAKPNPSPWRLRQ